MSAKKRSPKRKSTGKSREQTPDERGPIEVQWALTELPSAQHRAGLAGLVLAIRYLNREPLESICELLEVTSTRARVRFDERGLKSLFDLVYAAATEEIESKTRWKGKEPIRTETREHIDPKTKKLRKTTVYVYPQVVPRGATILDLDPTRNGDRGLFVKLWRELVWSVLRGVPKQRLPYEARAKARESNDWRSALEQLTESADDSVKLASTHFLGAQESSADNVAFRDRGRFQFLLNFWPLAVTVYVPQVEDREGKIADEGYSIIIPDVADLATFCDDFMEAMRQRDPAAAGYRPRESLITLPVEGALALLASLKARLVLREGQRSTSDLVAGLDVIHALKEGNNVRLKAVTRLDPHPSMVDAYAAERAVLTDLAFRRQRVANVLYDRPWHYGFDRLFAEMPHERFIGRRAHRFSQDARTALERFMKTTEDDVANQQPQELEAILLSVVSTFIARRLKAKGLDWQTSKDDEVRRGRYNEEREKVARGAFLACRSRTDSDFVDYFAGTLCSVPQHIDNESFRTLSEALRNRPQEVRTLTMLALSAKG